MTLYLFKSFLFLLKFYSYCHIDFAHILSGLFKKFLKLSIVDL